MRHINQFKDLLEETFGMTTVVEPSQADGTKLIRILPENLELMDCGQIGTQTSIPYEAVIPLRISWRISGGNESLSLTSQALSLSIRIAEFFRHNPFITLKVEQETLAPGLRLEGEAISEHSEKLSGEFARIENNSNTLFLYREDWRVRLRVRIIRDHTPTNLTAASFNHPSNGSVTIGAA